MTCLDIHITCTDICSISPNPLSNDMTWNDWHEMTWHVLELKDVTCLWYCIKWHDTTLHMGHMASYYVIDITQTDLNDMKHVCTWHHALIDLTWDDMKWHDIMWHILGMAWYLACMWLVRFVIQITYLTHLTLTCNFLTYIFVVTWCNICLSWNEMTCT